MILKKNQKKKTRKKNTDRGKELRITVIKNFNKIFLNTLIIKKKQDNRKIIESKKRKKKKTSIEAKG